MTIKSTAFNTDIKRLTVKHADQLMAFEIKNRQFFERNIAPRDNEFYTHSGVHRHINDLHTEFSKGLAYPGLLIQNNLIVGRVNLRNIDIARECAEIGYRIGEADQGQGLASLGVSFLIRIATHMFNLSQLSAIVLDNNPASKRVLQKSGFINMGSASHVEMIQNKELGSERWVKQI